MRDVAIIGVGQTPVDEHWTTGIRHLALQATLGALRDADVEQVDAVYVGNMLSGEITGQSHLGALVADFAGMAGVEAMKVEAACASGAAAMRVGYLAVASGLIDLALVVGVEKMTDTSGRETTAALAMAADAEYEVSQGISFVALNALLMRRYMHEYGVAHEAFAPFAVIAHGNGVNNPHAMYRSPISAEAYARAGMVADPISMFDGAPLCDGAAAVLLCPSDIASRFSEKPVRIRASAAATDRLALHSRNDVLFLQAAFLSAQRAFLQAGIGPGDVQFFELHDAFSILAALSLEACGFAERGGATHLAKDGQFDLHGKMPICTMGGLKARGHPIGASGVYQIVEAAQQLRGEAGANQVEAHLGMTQSLGGTGATAITHILEV